jgi:hypothetical protein
LGNPAWAIDFCAGFEVLTAVVMKSSINWDMSRSLLKANILEEQVTFIFRIEEAD